MARLRAELDGLSIHPYGLERDELAYILDTFPIVRRKDEERWGEAWGEPFGFPSAALRAGTQDRPCRTLSDKADGVEGV